MRLLRLEVRKILSSAAIWAFAALCVIFNITLTGYNDIETAATTNVFEGYSTEPVATAYIRAMGLTGGLADKMNAKYAALQPIANNKSQNGDSFGQYSVWNHSGLFKYTMLPLLIEGLILAVLITLLSVGWEHLNQTEAVVYSSRTGRNIAQVKFAAAALCSLALYGGLTLVTLAAKLGGFRDILGDNVSSCFNYISGFVAGVRPFITWRSLAVWQYMLACIAVSCGIVLCFSLIAFIFGTLIRNAYAGFLAVFTLSAVCVTMAVALPAGLAKFLSVYTPVWLALRLPLWFTDGGMDYLWRDFETRGLCANLVILGLLAVVSAKKYKRSDIL